MGGIMKIISFHLLQGYLLLFPIHSGECTRFRPQNWHFIFYPNFILISKNPVVEPEQVTPHKHLPLISCITSENVDALFLKPFSLISIIKASLKPKITTQVPGVWAQNSDFWIHSEEKRQQTVSHQGMERENYIHLFLSQIATCSYSWDIIMDSNHIFPSRLSFGS